jgi:hypothetical protein
MRGLMFSVRALFLVLTLWLASASSIWAFALIGRGGVPGGELFPAWQRAAAQYDGFSLDYDFPGDIGGPMLPDEGYRWNIPVIYYAFDQSFINYFGKRGMREVEKAIAVFNNLPPFNQIPTDGRFLFIRGEPVPFQTARENFEATALGLLDLKSTAMIFIIEELGLAEPERWTWTLLGRDVVGSPPVFTNYTVGHRNFDPITIRPSSFVNETLYTFDVFESGPPNRAEAIEFQVDPLEFGFSSVAGGLPIPGRFFTGLTHDDVGGLRWLYRTNRLAVENLETNVVAGIPRRGSSSPWAPFFASTNLFAIGTNFIFNTNIVRQGLRPGINKLTFQRVNFDSLLGNLFVPITNRYTDTYFSNGVPVIQPVERVVQFPDLVFSAGRLGLAGNLIPGLIARTDTANWQNNDAINGFDGQTDGGPGVIEGPVQITFTDQLPFFSNEPFFFSSFLSTPRPEPGLPFGWTTSALWGSFDGTTAEPFIYPVYGNITINDLRQFSAGGGN